MKQSNGFDPIKYAFDVVLEKAENYRNGSRVYSSEEIRSMFQVLGLCCHGSDSQTDAEIEELAYMYRDEFRTIYEIETYGETL